MVVKIPTDYFCLRFFYLEEMQGRQRSKEREGEHFKAFLFGQVFLVFVIVVLDNCEEEVALSKKFAFLSYLEYFFVLVFIFYFYVIKMVFVKKIN